MATVNYRATEEQYHRRQHTLRPKSGTGVEDCYWCGRNRAKCKAKRSFPDVFTAGDAALAQNIETGWVRAVHAYPCRCCGLYHLATAKKKHHRERVEKQRRKWLAASALRPSHPQPQASE